MDINPYKGSDEHQIAMCVTPLFSNRKSFKLFAMQRPNVLSFGDHGIVRGLRTVCRHRVVTRPLFEKYRRRFSPYCSVASLYLWEVSGGAIPELTDPAPRKKAAP